MTAATKRRRLRYRVQWMKRARVWRVMRTGGDFSFRRVARTWERKADAVLDAVQSSRMWWGLDIPAQVIVHGKDGRIQYERTYGHDPRRRKG